MKFELNQDNKFEWVGLTGYPYSSIDDFKNASAAYFEVTGSHGKVKSTKSDRIYYVIEGQGEFVIGDKSFDVKASDVIIVPKNTIYDYHVIEGVLKLFLVHAPAYDSKAEIRY
jgi:mannose-6-phosphate isomerase-like protein (cupin superfamily)